MEDYFYDDDDMLTEIKIGTTVVKSFGYDAAGRRTSATNGGVTTTYAYDYESRITGITRTGTTANAFAYNGFDTRVSKTDSSGTTSYKRAGAYVTDPLLKSTISSTTTDYTPGVSSRVSSASTFLHSGIKNADEQSDDTGDISASRQYDAFGNLVSSNQTWQGPFGYGGPYGYQSDADHGLMLLGHRYYEADTGRFLTRDPIKDGRNWYGYCGGNPLHRVDVSGLAWHDPVNVRVSASFRGRVIAYGDFPWMKAPGWRDAEVKPGYQTHPTMDVDMVLIMKPGGSAQLVFLMGNGIPGDGEEVPSCYRIDSSGRVRYDPICQNPPVPAGPAWNEVWVPMWSAWIEEAYNTGFPVGFSPYQSPLEGCSVR